MYLAFPDSAGRFLRDSRFSKYSRSNAKEFFNFRLRDHRPLWFSLSIEIRLAKKFVTLPLLNQRPATKNFRQNQKSFVTSRKLRKRTCLTTPHLAFGENADSRLLCTDLRRKISALVRV